MAAFGRHITAGGGDGRPLEQPMTTDGRHDEQRQFLERVFGPMAGSGLRFCVWSGPPARLSYWCESVAQALDAVNVIGDGLDIYAGPGLAAEDLGSRHRVSIATCAGLVAAVADIDIAGEAHAAQKHYPRSEDAALELVAALPLDPSIVVHSGNGLHLWWLLEKPWVFGDDEERESAIVALQAWGATLKAAADELGYDLDSVHDLARVLRVPGTLNQKSRPPRPVCLIEISDVCYDIEELSEWTPAGWVPGPSAATTPATTSTPVSPIDLGIIHARLTELLLQDPELRGAWERTAEISDQSASGYVQSVANRLAIRHGWGEADLSGAIQAFYSLQHREGDHALNGSKLSKTVARALTAAREVEARRAAEREERWAGLTEGGGAAPAASDGEARAEDTDGADTWDGMELAGDGAVPAAPGRSLEPTEEQVAALQTLLGTVEAERDVQAVWDAVGLLAQLPAATYGAAKAKLRQVLGEQLNLRDLQAAVKDARLRAKEQRRRDDDRPMILVGRQLRDVMADALAALEKANDPPVLYVRAGQVVRVTTDEHGRPVIATVSTDALRGRLAAVANWTRCHREAPRDVSPPDDVTRTLLAAPEHPFPALETWWSTPVLRRMGRCTLLPGTTL
jgi:hypothetical protein